LDLPTHLMRANEVAPFRLLLALSLYL
jgi:hypothetical protein